MREDFTRRALILAPIVGLGACNVSDIRPFRFLHIQIKGEHAGTSFFDAIRSFASANDYWLNERADDFGEQGVYFSFQLDGWDSMMSIHSETLDRTPEELPTFSSTAFEAIFYDRSMVSPMRRAATKMITLIDKFVAAIEHIDGVEVLPESEPSE